MDHVRRYANPKRKAKTARHRQARQTASDFAQEGKSDETKQKGNLEKMKFEKQERGKKTGGGRGGGGLIYSAVWSLTRCHRIEVGFVSLVVSLCVFICLYGRVRDIYVYLKFFWHIDILILKYMNGDSISEYSITRMEVTRTLSKTVTIKITEMEILNLYRHLLGQTPLHFRKQRFPRTIKRKSSESGKWWLYFLRPRRPGAIPDF